MKLLTRIGWICFCLLNAFVANAQNCQFDSYSKKGSLYFFSTYFESVSVPRNGECLLSDHLGRVYARRNFKDGIIQDEFTIHLESQKPYTIYKRIDKDSTIGLAQYHDVLGRKNQEVLYYWGNGHRRSWTQTDFYMNGKKKKEATYCMIPLTEMTANGYALPPAHIIDAEGYADDIVPWGWELEFHENGKLKSKKFHRYIVADNGSNFEQYSLEGKVVEYYDDGQKLLEGFYLNGSPDSLWQYYFQNGRLSGVKQFKENLGTGVWREYHDNGITSFEHFYNEDIYDPFNPHLKQYNRNGVLVKEKWIKSDGKGFLREYYDNGSLANEELFDYGPRENVKQRKFYRNGQLQMVAYRGATNDTSFASYYENGQVETYTSSGVHRNYQEQFFPNGQKKMIMESVNFLDHRSYHYSLYQENGKPLKRIDSVQDTTDEFEYFSNGQLKKKLRREANRLNGDFREWDSLGTIQSKLIYRNGFRVKKTVMDSSVTKKREVRHLSAAQKNSINNWVRYSLIKRYPTNSNGTQGIQLSADSVDMMCKDIQRAMSMMPENWFSEIPTFDGEQDVFFRYRFTIRNDGDTIFTKWKELCNLLNLEVVHTDAANGKWLQGEVKSNNFFSPDFIQYQWMVLCKSCPISISVLPFDESKIKLLTNEDKFDQYGDSYISIHYTSLSGVALVQWDTPSGVKLFTLYADDLECFNRDWNWEIPVREVNLMKWD